MTAAPAAPGAEALDPARGLAGLAEQVLRTADAAEKAALSRRVAALWREGGLAIGAAAPPLTPARPARPELVDPRAVPRRRPGTPEGRRAMIHAIAHIELNAVDLHWDAIARFAGEDLPHGYFDDWARAADEEAKHFQLLSGRLAAMGGAYGDLPAHAGMWRAAEATAHDVMARLAIAPMVLEARGLDVTPQMIDVFKRADDLETSAVLETIYAEEVGHVAYGAKWFHFLCGRRGLDPKPTFHALVRRYFGAPLKPPFNDEKRAEAGLPFDFYWPLAENADQE